MNEWDSEPDRKHWIDSATGLDCLIVRNPVTYALCGYVGVPEGHPWHGKGYDDVDAEVHGGLTFADACTRHVCHGENGEVVANKDVWWLGFDCAHAWDIIPLLGRSFSDATYKNIAFVECECRSLAAQIRNAA